MKILYMTNIPSPYRVKFFSQLGKLVDLTVLYELHNASNRDGSWKAEDVEPSYNEVFLKGIQVISDGSISFDVFSYLNDEYDFIVIGTHGTPTAKLAMFYMRLRGIPYILNIDGMLSEELNQKSLLNRLMRKFLFQGASAYFTSGKDTDCYLKKLGIDVASKCYHYHFSSVDNKDIVDNNVFDTKKQIRDTLDLKEKFIVMCVARFIPKKGIDVLLRAFAGLSRQDTALVIVGGNGTVYDSVLSGMEDEIRSHVYFPGFMGKQKLAQYYRASDVFVLPTHHDEWGLVINEAMANGLPIITTDKCGAGLEIIQDGENGFLVKDNDEAGLKNKINSLIDNKELRQYISENNIKVAHQYTIETMVKDHIKHFKALQKVGKK